MAKAFIKHIDKPKIGLDGTGQVIQASASDPVLEIIKDLPDVKVNDDIVDRSTISIPSPWAVFLSFDSIFFGDTVSNDVNGFGKIAEKAKKDWRAMLTMMAFRPLLGVNIKTETYYISENINGERFFDLILKTIPKNHIFGEKCWNEITLIKVGNDENVIGAFSNSSLVCPGYKGIKEGFEKEFSRCPGLFWNEEEDEGVYPLTFIRKTRFRCFFMYKWISAVLEILRKINVYKNKEKFCDKKGYLDILTDELKQFQKEIAEDILDKEVRDEMKGLVKVKIKDEYLKVNEESKAFKKLSTDEQKEKKDSIRKNVRKFIENGNIRSLFEMLEVTVDFNVPYIKDTIKQGNRYFIEAIEEIGEKAEGLELKRIYDMASDENSLYNIVHLDEAQVLQKDDIFTDKLGIIYDPANPENGVPMLEKHFVKIGNRKIEGGGDIEYCSYALIPIKKAVINDELLGVDYNSIKRNIKYENIGDSILVTLSGSGRPVMHKYTKDKIINISFAKLPNICIWPYARIKNVNGESVWNDYYAYIERKSSIGRRNRGNAEENEKIVYTFKRDIDDKKNKLDLASGRLGERVVVKLNELPEYIFVDNKTASSSEEAGIIILNEPEREDVVIPSVGEPATLGIDFGTTSSTMFYKIGDDAVKFVEFGAKYKMNLRNNQWERQSVDSQEDICIEEIVMSGDPEPYFMPKQFFDRKAYLSSYLLTSKSPDVNNEMLMIGHIVFDETQTGNNDNTRLFKNAKWGRRDIDETIRHGYLMQILKMAEFTILKTGRVKSIKLRASYPTALSDFNKINLKNNYKNIINALNKSAPVFSFDGLFTESISSALVFRNASTINYACIDIGGGSTDISLWKFNTAENRNENIFQSSFKFASRDIFVPALARFVLLSSPEPGDESKLQVNIKRLNSKYADAIDNAKKNYDSDPRETINSLGIELEEALFKFSDDIIALHDSADYDIVKVFDRDIITGFLAIVYYTVISYANGVRNYGFEKIVGDLNICFAGNGSKMYNWIDSEYLERMQKMLTVLANHKDMGGIFSGKGHKVSFREPDMQELKTEAARGLIEVTEAENTKNNDILINGDFICFRTKSGRNIAYSAGDNIKEKKKIKNLFSDNKGKEDADSIREPNFKFDDFEKGNASGKYFTEIERFVNVLNKVLKYDEMQIDFNDSVKRAFRKRFAEVYHEFMMEKSIIPVFIAEVIAFMDVIKEDNYYDEEDLDDDYSFDDEEDFDDENEFFIAPDFEDDEGEEDDEDIFADKSKKPEKPRKSDKSGKSDKKKRLEEAEEDDDDDDDMNIGNDIELMSGMGIIDEEEEEDYDSDEDDDDYDSEDDDDDDFDSDDDDDDDSDDNDFDFDDDDDDDDDSDDDDSEDEESQSDDDDDDFDSLFD